VVLQLETVDPNPAACGPYHSPVAQTFTGSTARSPTSRSPVTARRAIVQSEFDGPRIATPTGADAWAADPAQSMGLDNRLTGVI